MPDDPRRRSTDKPPPSVPADQNAGPDPLAGLDVGPLVIAFLAADLMRDPAASAEPWLLPPGGPDRPPIPSFPSGTS